VSDAHLRRDEIVVETTRWMQRRWPSQCQEAARYFNAAVQDIGEEKLRLVTGAGADLLRSFLAQEIGFTMWMEPETRVSRLKKRLPVGVKAALRTSLRLLRLRR
jgi:hypothetical protein